MSRILTTLHGGLVGLNDKRQLQCGKGFRSGEHGSQRTHGSPSTVEFWDDFVGDVIADQWNVAVGTDTLPPSAAILAGGIGGQLKMIGGNDGTIGADLVMLTQALQWQASNGGLAIEARFNMDRITTAYCFFGFTDLVTVEAPITVSGTTYTTNASDAVGFLFHTAATTDTWHLTGVAANTDATAQVLTTAPAANTFATYRVELSATGVATFFINGVQVGTAMSGAVTAATDLTPVLAFASESGTTSMNGYVDYVHVSMDR